ncbi:MAG TPA: polysaccharide biosynthesis protein, partial [Spirochaetia bacterium]|nr:polysaccharide biosynthesis protein [Spirochaetia bacterium]
MKRIYIIGAGFTGQTIAHELKIKRIFGRVVAFLDDDADKIGRKIDSIPILGPIEAVAELLKKTPADEAIIAIPGGTPEQLKRIYTVLKKAGFVTIRIVPSISQILGGEAHLIQAREINVDDFLTRKPIAINLKESLGYVKGKRVLV